MGCNCGGRGGGVAPPPHIRRPVWRHHRTDGTTRDYMTPEEAYAALHSSGGRVERIPETP
ncbi:hypothetical protein [Streptomyces zingiberis]|uniref:SPOR domain-containing protein n=1 Tax=Streptomyces zingiberis TaxID=2053010 RepID=A0ABX1BWV1_9ACTN|nr:hypothetical protein [Streptomyces zingiberis]NJQ00217.1 hypothetical protein [Streptomyces zingiberis]